MSEIDFIQDLADKNLQTVPRNVLNMSNLKMLYLEGNYLEEIPNELFILLEKLSWLDVRNNKLKSIPITVMNHPNLETFLLQNNEIESLPTELGFVPNLKILQVSKNPIIYPKKSVIDQGLDGIIKFLRSEYQNNKVLVEDNSPKSAVDGKTSESPDREIYSGEKKLEMPIITLKSFHRMGNHSYRKRSRTKRGNKSRSSLNIYKNHWYSNSNKYLQKLPSKRNELRVQEQYIREVWLKKLKEIKNRQDEILQREKDLEVLNNWRRNIKYKTKTTNLSYRPEAPFDFDPEYDQMPSRCDLHKRMYRSRRLSTSNKPKNINIDKLISDIVESLKAMERERNMERSPRTQMDTAGRDIKRILELQKRISALKLSNEKFL